jgi:cytochrome c biogenesis factor
MPVRPDPASHVAALRRAIPQLQRARLRTLDGTTVLLLLLLTALCPLAPQLQAQPQRAKRLLLALVLASGIVPILLLFLFPLSLAAASGFWAAAFLLLSWLSALLRKRVTTMRLGVALIHIGLAVLALGILGVETLSGTYEGQLAPGDTLNEAGYRFTAGEVNSYLDRSGNVVFDLPMTISRAANNSTVTPAIVHYTKLGTLYARPGLATGWLQDVQVILEDTPLPSSQAYSMRIAFYPLIDWIWAGGLLMVVGGLLGLTRRKTTAAV